MRVPVWVGYTVLPALIAAAVGGSITVSSAENKLATSGKTIGLVVTNEMPGHWESPGARVECPDGLQFNEKENWDALSEEVREERGNKFGHRWNRGPNGENNTAVPWAIKDPLPFREVQSKIAYGFNLDGTDDGRATAQTCTHEKFQGLDGETAVDNQLYRVMGCTQGWRVGGAAAEYRVMEYPTYSHNRMLIEISNVDSELNDDEVNVAIYKGLDTILKDSKGEFLPNFTQRIDARFPTIATTRGRIENGVLSIDPVDFARYTMRWNVATGTRDWYDMHLRLELTDDGAEGLIGGYQDLENYWLMYRRGLSISVDNSAWSPPSMYQASVRLADGRRDPATGKCTAISSVLKIKAVRAFIVHPSDTEDPGLYDLRGY
jgi:hypothetical protein